MFALGTDQHLRKPLQFSWQSVEANADLVADKPIGIPFMQHFAREIITQPVIWNCLTSKHPACEHEQEVRLVIMGTQ